MMIGFMLNLVLPGRVGEIARPVILNQKDGIPFASGIATVVTERLFDLVVLLILLSVTLAYSNIDPDIEIRFNTLVLKKTTIEVIGKGLLNFCLLLIFGIVILLFQKSSELISNIMMKLPSLLFREK